MPFYPIYNLWNINGMKRQNIKKASVHAIFEEDLLNLKLINMAVQGKYWIQLSSYGSFKKARAYAPGFFVQQADINS